MSRRSAPPGESRSAAALRFEPGCIGGWHAHVYYRDAAERAHAARLRSAVEARFEVELGRWRDTPVGPHPLPMYQIAFAAALLPEILPWLMAARGNLAVLVHARTDTSDLMDHTQGALWLGESLPLALEFFDRDGKSA